MNNNDVVYSELEYESAKILLKDISDKKLYKIAAIYMYDNMDKFKDMIYQIAIESTIVNLRALSNDLLVEETYIRNEDTNNLN